MRLIRVYQNLTINERKRGNPKTSKRERLSTGQYCLPGLKGLVVPVVIANIMVSHIHAVPGQNITMVWSCFVSLDEYITDNFAPYDITIARNYPTEEER